MAREQMVTRTIMSTTVVALGTDIVNQEVKQITVTLPRTYKNDDAILKVLAKEYNTDTFKVVSVVAKEERSELYGLSEKKFLEMAVVLDENRKPIINSETELATEE